LTLNWKTEFNRWFPHRTVAVVTGRKEFPAPADVVVIGWSNISAHADRLLKYAGYVFDESHYAKNDTAQRSKSAIKIAKTCPADGVVLCLTGTPITNRPAEFAAQLDILGLLKAFGGKHGFYRRYCGAFRDRWGHWHIDGATNLEELNTKLREAGYIRRLKGDVLGQLDPVAHNPILVEGDPTVMREYAKAEADIVAFLMERARQIAEEIGEDPRSAAVRAKIMAESAEHLVRMSVLRKIAAKAKMGAVIELVDTHIEVGQKVILAAHHREIVDTLAEKFGGLKIQGQMTVTEIEAHKSRFQTLDAGAAPVIVLSIQAAKTGHTLTAAQDVVFVEFPWTWADIEQTYSRAHRLGQQGSVTSTYVLTRGTIDEAVYEAVLDKRAVVGAATDGSAPTDDLSVGSAVVGALFDRAFT
jgi:SNF2 family DNA or RNA helicase